MRAQSVSPASTALTRQTTRSRTVRARSGRRRLRRADIAEFANTLSNLFFILLAAYGWRKARKHRLPLELAILHLGIATVGVGSFLFHGTLLYEWQLADELPMLWASSLLTYAVYAQPTKPRTQARSTLPLALGIIAVNVFVTVIYLRNPNPVFHQLSARPSRKPAALTQQYASIQAVTILRVVYLLRNTLRSTPLEDRRRTAASRLLIVSSLIFGLGFAIWNVECVASLRLI